MRTIVKSLPAALLALLVAVSGPVSAFGEEPFIIGVDVSELTAQENSGAGYFNAAGRPADALRVLSDSGVNYIRLRVWNNPTDGAGHGYGAGNIDADVAAALSARASSLGIKTLLDFHYSDFWADPARQLAPKAWQNMSVNEKRKALYTYTKDTLNLIFNAGGDVGMVQIGNETINGIAGEQDLPVMAELITSGCSAAREVARGRKTAMTVCVHLTEIQDMARIIDILDTLDSAGADYDAVGLSYYPYWHGDLQSLDNAIRAVLARGKQVFVAETAWPFTLEDGDGWPNVVSDNVQPYPATPEGQAQAFRDVCKTAENAGAIGVFYWGGIWTPVGRNPADNREKWETFGSGWATRYASVYDPVHVGESYGGCAWDNQALFDFDGYPLPILTGLSDGIAKPDVSENYVINPGFEQEDYSMWKAASFTGSEPFDYQNFINDAHSGTVAFHYWSEQDMDFTISQTVTVPEPGLYEASLWSQGGDMKNASLTLFVIADGQDYKVSFANTVWADWQHPVIRNIPVKSGKLIIGARIRCSALSWGTLDDFQVIREK